jgi:hypothetical protein
MSGAARWRPAGVLTQAERDNVPPSLILAILLGSIYGLLFHSVFGRRLWQLPWYWLSSVVGFLAGEILASLAGVELFRLGTIPLGAATAGALVGLAICWFFTSPLQPRPRRRVTRRRPVPGGPRGE